MAKSTRRATQPPRVSGRVLAWARERALLRHEQVAEHLGLARVEASTIQGWERGEPQPSLAQARRLARLYRIPERWLFFDTPPDHYDDLGIVDYRTPNPTSLRKPSLNLRSAIEHALAVQAWVVEHRTSSGEPPCPFVAAKSMRQSPKVVARHIVETFDLVSVRAASKDAADFFTRMRQRVEEQGVLVLKMGQVANKTRWSLDPDEFKGFTLIDEDRLAPLVFINSKDHPDACLFTLVHELAHVVTGGSGVSNEDIEDIGVERANIEIFCDEVAAQVLVPLEDFERVWKTHEGSTAEKLASMAASLKVTPLVFARRAAVASKISERSFHEYARRWRQAPLRKPRKEGSGGPGADRTRPSWYGRGLAELLSAAACTGHAAAADALDLLGIKLDVARTIVERAEKAKAAAKMARKQLPRMGAFEPIPIDARWKDASRLGS